MSDSGSETRDLEAACFGETVQVSVQMLCSETFGLMLKTLSYKCTVRIVQLDDVHTLCKADVGMVCNMRVPVSRGQQSN